MNVGKKIELPLWLASQLGEFVLHDIPKQYRTKFQDILASDPEVVNLHREGPKYYGMGLRVSLIKISMKHDKAEFREILKMKILNFLGLQPLVCANCMTQVKLFLQLATNRLDFADNEDIIKLCNTLLQAYSRRISWIGDQANGENKIESRLDDMEKVKTLP